MNRRFMRPLAVGVATLSTVAGLAVGAVSSHAATIGTFTFTPGSGVDLNSLTLDTSAACDNGDHFQIYVAGPGFPAAPGFGVTANNDIGILPGNPAGGYTIGLQDTLHAFAQQQNPPATLAGTYTFTGQCKTGFTNYGTFTGSVVFTQNGANPPSFVANNPAVSTTIGLVGTPASPVNTGVPVAFAAHVTAASGTPTGTVQLMDGATPVGAAATINAAGNATITAPFTAAGGHTITAVFTGGSGFANATSPALAYTVNQAPADATNTALAITPAAATSVDPVTLTATVTDTVNAGTKPTGAVQFSDGGSTVGSPVALVNGVASLTQPYAAGGHSFTAVYTPTAITPAVFVTSSAAAQAFTVTAFAGVSASEKIETTVVGGSLNISVPDTSTVVLPSPTLNATATYLTTSGRIHPVTVTDTRAGNPGWTLSGQVSDFQNTTGATTTPIAGVNLGWTPNVIDQNPGQNVIAGPVVAPQTPPLVADPAVATAAGLQAARILASAAAGAGTGTAHVDALLALNVPTTVIAGTYDATLTLTAI